jgi:hypothetical protein
MPGMDVVLVVSVTDERVGRSASRRRHRRVTDLRERTGPFLYTSAQ